MSDGTVQNLALTPGATAFAAEHIHVDNPTGQPTGSYPISASVADQTGLSSAAVDTAVEVDNVAPGITGLSFLNGTIAEGGTATLVGKVVDPGVNDTETVQVTWADGTSSAATVDQTTRQFTAIHLYVDNKAGQPNRPGGRHRQCPRQRGASDGRTRGRQPSARTDEPGFRGCRGRHRDRGWRL